METTKVVFCRHFIVLYLLEMVTPSSEQFVVNALKGPILAPFGGQVELSCQLSPPQSAQNMEIRWFRDRYTQPIYLFKEGKDLYGETISRYVERTELLKDAIGDGKVTLRIFNVSVEDDGRYHCFFRDGDFSEEDIAEVKVTATSSDIQILILPSNNDDLRVECNSGGWFPQPQMEWRDSRGEILLPASKSHSQDRDKLFDMKMTILLSDSHPGNVTCYLRNPLTGQEERTNIVLPGQKMFSQKMIWLTILNAILIVPLLILGCLYVKKLRQQGGRCCNRNSPLLVITIIIISSMVVSFILSICLEAYQKVPASDPLFELNAVWINDTNTKLMMLMFFITLIISLIFCRITGQKQSERTKRESNVSSETVNTETTEKQDANPSEGNTCDYPNIPMSELQEDDDSQGESY